MNKVTKVDNYYVSDLQWYIVRKHPELRRSTRYEICQETFLDMTMGKSGELLNDYIRDFIRNAIRMDAIAKKKKDDSMRLEAATMCLAIIDLI